MFDLSDVKVDNNLLLTRLTDTSGNTDGDHSSTA